MAFFKKVKKKVNDLWYPQTVTVGKPVTTEQIAADLAAISTVSLADTRAVLSELGVIMGRHMATGRTVKLDGVGTFYFTIAANKQGKEKPEDVTADCIAGVRVRFIPETHYQRQGGTRQAIRSITSVPIFWEEWGKRSTKNGVTPDEDDTDGGDDGE